LPVHFDEEHKGRKMMCGVRLFTRVVKPDFTEHRRGAIYTSLDFRTWRIQSFRPTRCIYIVSKPTHTCSSTRQL